MCGNRRRPGGAVYSAAVRSDLQCSFRKEDTGWISLGLTDPSCHAKDTSHSIILLGLTVSV